jgi:hypothetical protein
MPSGSTSIGRQREARSRAGYPPSMPTSRTGSPRSSGRTWRRRPPAVTRCSRGSTSAPASETVGSTSSACATCRPGSDGSGTAASAAHRARISPERSHAVALPAPVATRSHRRARCAMPGQPCGSCSATPSVRSCSRATSRGWCGSPRRGRTSRSPGASRKPGGSSRAPGGTTTRSTPATC